MSDKIKQQIALLESQVVGTNDLVKLPPVLNNKTKQNNNESSSSITIPVRYIVKFAHIPSEAFYCTAKTWRDLCSKTQQVWGIDRPYFTFTTLNALDRQVTFRLTCAADFETVWSNPEAPAMQADQKMQEKLLQLETREEYRLSYTNQESIAAAHKTNGGQFFGKVLLAHDHRNFRNVAHSADYYQYAIRPFVSAGLLSYWPVRYVIRHTTSDEVMFVANVESSSWGYAVQKCQSEWGVLRPLFRYVDDIEGERTIISIVTAEDYMLWFKRRRPLWPELLVFEHAAPSLLTQHKEELLGVAGKYLRDDSDNNNFGNTTRGSSRASQRYLPQFENMPDEYPFSASNNMITMKEGSNMKRGILTNSNRGFSASSNQKPNEEVEGSPIDNRDEVETDKFIRLTAAEKRLMQTNPNNNHKRNPTSTSFPLFSSSYQGGSHGISPLEPDTNRGISYYPSKTSGFPIANHNNNNNNSSSNSTTPRNQSRDSRSRRSPPQQQQQTYSSEANALLSSFRKESLQTKTEWEKVQEERQYQAVRAKHVRELEKALLTSNNNNTPRRGNL